MDLPTEYEELLPAQPVTDEHLAKIYVVEGRPEPGWEGPTFHLRVRVTRIGCGTLAYQETYGPLRGGDPLATGLTDEDAHELADRLERLGERIDRRKY